MPKTTKTTKLRATKGDLVKPPGTPVRVSATPETVPEARVTPASCSTGEICFVCTTVILEASTEREGEPALLCEGRHKSWAHTRCVGISDVLYEDIQSCETPWMCRECSKEAAIALQNVPLVQEEVQSLKAENIGLREELSEMRALITSLNTALTTLETKVTTVSATVELLQSEPSIPKAGSSTSDTMNRPEFHQTRRAPNADVTQQNNGTRGRGRGRGRGHRGSRQRNQQRNQNIVSLPGKRKVWGTRKVCSSSTVRNTIIKQISLQISINVKRKFKLGSGNKIVKWWHVVSGNEETMALLEQEWDKVKDQTSWNIEPCLSYVDDSEASENQNPQSGIHAIVRNNALGNVAMNEEANKVSGSPDNADEQGTSQSTIANNQPFLCQ